MRCMKKDDERLTLGEKQKRKNLIDYWLLISLFGLCGAAFFYNMLKMYLEASFIVYLSTAIIVYIAIVLFLMPLLSGSAERITFDDDYIVKPQILYIY